MTPDPHPVAVVRKPWGYWLVSVGPLSREVSDADLFFDGGAVWEALAELTGEWVRAGRTGNQSEGRDT